MTATITPVSQHDGAAISRSEAGERMMMDGGASPLATILQKLVDRTTFARDAVIGHLSWNGELSITGLLTNTRTNFTLNVGAINEVILSASGVYKPFAYAGGTVGASKVEGGGADLTAAAQVWHLYCWNNAGSLDFELSTTVPNGSRTFKTGDVTRRYLGCFVTTSAGAPIPFFCVRGSYTFRRSALAAPGALKVLDASTTPVGWTDISLAALIPAHARVVTINANVFGGGGGSAYLELRTKGDTGDVSLHILGGNATVNGEQNGTVEMITDPSRVIQYQLALGAGASLIGDIWLMGFKE